MELDDNQMVLLLQESGAHRTGATQGQEGNNLAQALQLLSPY